MSERGADRTPTSARLRAVFARILAVTGGLGGVALACGGATADRDSDGNRSSAPRSLCGADRPPAFPAGLRASPPQDYVAARVESAYLQGTVDGGEGEEAWVSRTSAPSGTPCATATATADCNRRLAELRVLPKGRDACEAKYPYVTHPGGVHPGCRVGYLVYTRGDEVGTAVDDGEVHRLVGAIDTVQEADWVLRRTYEPTCGGPKGQDFTAREVEGGYEFVFANNCERESIIRTVHVGADGTVTERAQTKATPGMQFTCTVAGRRTEGQRLTEPLTGSARGVWLAEMAELEAVAVIAFRRLGRELASRGAPKELLSRVRDAIRDEIRHTRSMRALARREGIEPRTPCVEPSGTRELLAIALENVREGCVRETYGALVAWHQSIHAEDPTVREAMRDIAEDETDHAALSIDVADWLDGRLDAAERETVLRGRADALQALHDEIDAAVDPVLERGIGLPGRARGRALLEALSRAA